MAHYGRNRLLIFYFERMWRVSSFSPSSTQMMLLVVGVASVVGLLVLRPRLDRRPDVTLPEASNNSIDVKKKRKNIYDHRTS